MKTHKVSKGSLPSHSWKCQQIQGLFLKVRDLDNYKAMSNFKDSDDSKLEANEAYEALRVSLRSRPGGVAK